MSRSYKKKPVVTDNGDSKKSKKIVSRQFRKRANRAFDEPWKGNNYRKAICSYNIRDYTSYCSQQESDRKFKAKERHWATFDSLEESRIWWKKEFLSK